VLVGVGWGLGGGCEASLLEVAGLIFLAEWGDRSMLATIALGAAQVGGLLLVT
jgi:putative Ca2+/H+ antiporter (TMEM165/GDT1 family)